MCFQIFFIVGLAIVHLVAGNIRFLQAWPRSAWLSFAGGISVSYVFVHVFPELEEAQEAIGGQGAVAFLEHHAYLIALVGLTLFYGLEHWVSQNKMQIGSPDSETYPHSGKRMFWLHIGTFALYNALVGYLFGSIERRRCMNLPYIPWLWPSTSSSMITG
ncbi:ZIP family metal transporter [Vreelandella lionensis]|uniref:ZIP family metal transporter n=1 Tax=Vreelandella lionensis TaxID=1144478 RepID=UPI001FB44FA7|nr:ZIP family metal transporter [Halomonas lionensis]